MTSPFLRCGCSSQSDLSASSPAAGNNNININNNIKPISISISISTSYLSTSSPAAEWGGEQDETRRGEWNSGRRVDICLMMLLSLLCQCVMLGAAFAIFCKNFADSHWSARKDL